jgi:aspartyl-tRNA(Asn)/glutamyl-tRNA(Gln) amidotransferase subunit C
MITDEELEKVAKIARISLSTKEMKDLHKDFENILSYFSEIQKLDTGEATHYVTTKTNTFREDKVVKCTESEEILKNAPKLEKKFFKVPKNL